MSAFREWIEQLADDPAEYAVTKMAWNAALEHAAKVCEQASHRDDDMGAILAAEIRKEIEK